MNIKSVLEGRKRQVSSIRLFDKVDDTIRFFSNTNCKAAVVLDDKQSLCGIVTEHDLVHCLGERGNAAADDTIDDIMSLDLVVCTPETAIREAIKLMSQHKIHHLPVVSEAGHLVGFVDMMEVMVKYIDSMPD
tara:strand:- start:159560 stop:159958 length:399 start_codon:yes stop_codon:yes gene_type:complete